MWSQARPQEREVQEPGVGLGKSARQREAGAGIWNSRAVLDRALPQGRNHSCQGPTGSGEHRVGAC